jgi:hypothetical protein
VTIIEGPIRRLDARDLPGCQDLAMGRGWAPAARRWGMLFRMGEVYAIPDPSSGLAAAPF